MCMYVKYMKYITKAGVSKVSVLDESSWKKCHKDILTKRLDNTSE